MNDLRDIETDRLHPEKSKRPLAAGLVSKSVALSICIIFILAGFGLVYEIANMTFLYIVLLYLGINFGYSFGLKHVGILDIMMVSSGFVLRTIGGGVVADVVTSQWMIVMIFLLALFLALAKRRDDLVVFMNSGNEIRRSIRNYNLEYVNGMLMMLSAVIIVCYLMYVISPEVMNRFHSHYLYLTAVFVIAGVMRYLQIALVENKSGSPTRALYGDAFIRFTVIAWVISFYIIIYRI